jgi:membrane protease subunit HflK
MADEHQHAHVPPPQQGDEGTRAMVRTLRLGFVTMLVVWVALAVIYLFSGCFILDDNEQAYVLRFGEVVMEGNDEKIYAAGSWHWAWPKPIDSVYKVKTAKSQTVETTSFWYRSTRNMTSPNEQVPDDPSANLTVGQDFYAITGDNNIVHGQWALDYTISDPFDYDTRFAAKPAPDAEKSDALWRDDVIRGALDNAILKAYSHASLDDAMYAGADRLREEVLREVNKIVQQMQLGIVVTTVNHKEKVPPRATKAAFDAVTQAEQARDTQRLKAQQYAEARIPQAHQEAARILSEAERYKTTIVLNTESDSQYFQQIMTEINKAENKDAVLVALYNNALVKMVENAKAIYILKSGQQVRVKLNPPIKHQDGDPDHPENH